MPTRPLPPAPAEHEGEEREEAGEGLQILDVGDIADVPLQDRRDVGIEPGVASLSVASRDGFRIATGEDRRPTVG